MSEQLKPKLWRIRCLWVFWFRFDFYAWRCAGGGIEEGGTTPQEAFQAWQTAYNKPWRRALRWLRQLKKERA